ncbi:MAG TPA: hypothetical protein VFB12_24650 [Ktedonobacteraceae bacterium]|nr:hypothetical protein [Ktedonobacteraceae bacterium]
MARTFTKTFAAIAFLLLMAILAGCGSNDTTTPSSTNASSGAAGRLGSGGPRGQAITGTITQYNSSTKALTIKKSDGTTATFSLTSARILKSQKITEQQLSTLLGTSGTTVRVMGQQDSSGNVSAQSLVISDVNVGVGNGNGQPGGAPNGTPPANMAPGANGTPRANRTPGANGGFVVLRNGKLQNNQLVGTNQAGKSITVTLSGTTTIIQQTTGTASDLQTGQTVSIMVARAAGNTSSSSTDARQVVVGDTGQTPGN